MSSGYIILGIAFWVLSALSVICLMILCYIKFTYFKWERNDKEIRQLIEVSKQIMNNQKIGKDN